MQFWQSFCRPYRADDAGHLCSDRRRRAGRSRSHVALGCVAGAEVHDRIERRRGARLSSHQPLRPGRDRRDDAGPGRTLARRRDAARAPQHGRHRGDGVHRTPRGRRAAHTHRRLSHQAFPAGAFRPRSGQRSSVAQVGARRSALARDAVDRVARSHRAGRALPSISMSRPARAKTRR